MNRAIFFILKKYLLSSLFYKKENISSKLGLKLPTIGVSVGVFCFLVILSVMNGFVGELKSYLTSMEPHVEISYSSNSIFKDINEIIPSFNKFDENIEYHNSYIQEDVILKYSNENATLIKLRGIDINSKNEISMIKNHILVGDYKNIYEKKSNVPPIFLGKDLILGLNLNIDSIVTIIKAEDAGNI